MSLLKLSHGVHDVGKASKQVTHFVDNEHILSGTYMLI